MFSEKNLHKVMFTYLLAEKFRGSHFEFFVENLGETLCKLLQIFPPKVLVYIWTNFSSHFFDYLMEIH